VGDDARGVDPGSTGVEGGRGGTAGDRRLLAALLVAVNTPIAVATVRALARGWQPVGDNGILLVRARDVGTAHHPLLGSWTSASRLLGVDVNNPGPLYSDLLAPVIRLLGPWVGLAVGVMLVNMAASSLAVLAARRLTGAESMVAVALAVVGLQWALGSELLFDVWQPNALVLPFLAFLVTVTVLATGDMAMAPWVAAVGSLVVQTHVSHAVPVAVLAVAATALCVRAVRRGDRRGARRGPLLAAAAVMVLAWCQPLIEQFGGPGRGNLSRLAGAAATGEGPAAIGPAEAGRLVVEVAVMSGWFTRESYASAVPLGMPVVPVPIIGTVPSLVVLAAIGLAVVLGTIWAARAGRARAATLFAMAGLAVAAAWAALATAPPSEFSVVAHQMRWMWSVSAFVSAALLVAVLSLGRARRDLHRRVVVAGAVVVALVAVANLPSHTSRSQGPIADADHLDTTRALMGQLGSLEGRGTVLYDTSTLGFAEPYSGPTFAELQDRGIPFVVAEDDHVSVRQLGEGRRDDGTADLRLWQVIGPGARDIPPGAERVAFSEGPSGPVALFVEPIG
jgi:hypothetical protein